MVTVVVVAGGAVVAVSVDGVVFVHPCDVFELGMVEDVVVSAG